MCGLWRESDEWCLIPDDYLLCVTQLWVSGSLLCSSEKKLRKIHTVTKIVKWDTRTDHVIVKYQLIGIVKLEHCLTQIFSWMLYKGQYQCFHMKTLQLQHHYVCLFAPKKNFTALCAGETLSELWGKVKKMCGEASSKKAAFVRCWKADIWGKVFTRQRPYCTFKYTFMFWEWSEMLRLVLGFGNILREKLLALERCGKPSSGLVMCADFGTCIGMSWTIHNY